MNKVEAIKALKNGAILYINHYSDTSYVCTGATDSDVHRIRREIAEELTDMPLLNRYSRWNGVSAHSLKT